MLSVLFIGNSYTFSHDMTGTVERLAASDPDGPGLGADRSCEGGAHFADHTGRLGSRARIEAGRYTHVVLQDLSSGPLHDRPRFLDHGMRLAEAAHARNAAVFFFETWPRRPGHEAYRAAWSGGDAAGWLHRIREAYAALAEAAGGVVLPVGQAWSREGFAGGLYDADGHHPSPEGAWLTAGVVYRGLTGRSAQGCRHRPLPDASRLLAVADAACEQWLTAR